MKIKAFLIPLISVLIIVLPLMRHSIISAQAEQKKIMDHSIYDDWKTLQNPLISNNGNWVSYEINPARGDGMLYLYNTAAEEYQTAPRGTQAVFSYAGDFLAYNIKPEFRATREAKKKKKKKDAMPKDSLGVIITDEGSVLKFDRVKSFRVAPEGGDWLVIHHYSKKDTSKDDSVETDSVNNGKPKKPAGSDLTILHPLSREVHYVSDVTAYEVSGNGKLVAYIRSTGDSVRINHVSVFDTRSRQFFDLFEAEGMLEHLSISESGEQLAFLHHKDSSRTAGYNLYHWSQSFGAVKTIVDSLSEGMPEGWGVSKNGKLWFSTDESKLFFGTAPITSQEEEDSLLDEEKPKVDVWNWNDPLLQSMQKVQLKEDQKRNYLAVYSFPQERMYQLGDTLIQDVRTMFEGNGDYALGLVGAPYHKLISWKSGRYKDVYLIDLSKGSKTELLKAKNGPVYLSPAGKYLLWYETADSNWYCHDIESETLTCLSSDTDVAFYSETFDMPMDPGPYGVAGWTKDDHSVLIYDRYDIWKFDPSGSALPLNLTNHHGRSSHIVYRYQKLDKDINYIPSDEAMLLHGYNEDNKQTGFYSASPHLKDMPSELIQGTSYFESPLGSRDGSMLVYRRGTFTDYPDLWITGMEFKKHKQISHANPQGRDYLWGEPQLVHWTSFNGDRLDGILYTPEDFDEGRKYPMLVYFYERSSGRMYRHSVPAPSRSTINIPYCVSNGYVVFVPDIVYKEGYPGQGAYDAVVSGSMAMCRQFDFIDEKNMAIQGQSWGGYQVAYLVTRTNLYKAAMAGAPVSNMTSAYGGIRWGSGMSRMFQYEQSQSRIGGTLWERTPLYIENSPLFHAPRVNTPLLMMHNDTDGAVPWYQGIEFFVALRRLDKPAWLLVYNNEQHNLTKWPNRKDLSIRMMQFFDHYLKGAPAPVWMTQGVPAIEKGKNSGYQLLEQE